MSSSVTLDHVAREAGVSPSTVSRVLNGSARVAADKRTAVEAAVQRLGYRPNPFASGLASGRSRSIGVLTQDITSPFYGEALAGVEQALSGSSYHPVVVSGHWRANQEREAFEVLLARRVDALIVLGGHLSDERLRRVAERLPFIAVGRTVDGLASHCMHIDNAHGSYLGTRHLIDLGHRRIAYITGPNGHDDAIDRLAGYRRALNEAGLTFDPNLVVHGDFSEHSGLLATEALFARAAMFTAVQAANDQMAYGARLALYRRGIRVPDDISLVGFDGLQSSNYTTPPLTTVRQPTLEMCHAAGLAVLRLLESKDGGDLELPTFEPVLILRESTAPVRGQIVPAT